MDYQDVIKSSAVRGSDQQAVRSYDSGYEHSFEHWVELQRLVAESDEEAYLAMAASA